MFEWSKKISAGLLAFSLAGCMSLPANEAASPDAVGSQGVIWVSLVDRALLTAEGVGLQLENESGETLSIRGVDGEGSKPLSAEDGRGSVWLKSVAVKPGRYSVVNWSLKGFTGGMSKAAPPSELAFNVEAGKVVYIGSFNVFRPGQNAQFRDRHAQDLPLFKEAFPLLGSMEVRNEALSSDWWPLPGGLDMKRFGPVNSGTYR